MSISDNYYNNLFSDLIKTTGMLAFFLQNRKYAQTIISKGEIGYFLAVNSKQ